MILPDCTVICTWTAPKRVWTTAPGYVPAAFAVAPVLPVALEEPVEPEDSVELPEDPVPEPSDEVPVLPPVPVEVPAEVLVAELPVSAS